MPNITAPGLTFPTKAQTSGTLTGAPVGYANELLISELLGRYGSLAKSGRLFSAYASVTAAVAYSTAAGTGGPLIWNRPNSGVDAHILAVSFGGLSVASTVAGSLGLAGGVGQAVAPTTTTAIDASGNMLVGGPTTQMGGVYRVGTVANAASQFLPLVAVGTAAITAIEAASSWIDIGGGFVITPGTWGSIAANTTLTTSVVGIGVLWAELPA